MYEWFAPEIVYSKDDDGLNSPITSFYMSRCRVEEYDFELIMMWFHILQEIDPLQSLHHNQRARPRLLEWRIPVIKALMNQTKRKPDMITVGGGIFP